MENKHASNIIRLLLEICISLNDYYNSRKEKNVFDCYILGLKCRRPKHFFLQKSSYDFFFILIQLLLPGMSIPLVGEAKI